MVRKKFTDDAEVVAKIQALFDYRKLTELMQLGKLGGNTPWNDHLRHIQYQIYQLDAYLEGHWELDREAIRKFRQGILSALGGLGYTEDQAKALIREIRRYERIERDCREDRWPTRISFRKFYTTKSCDVRLMRHLIYTAAPSLQEMWKEKAWRYYDLITEINDDVADIEEDVSTYNGNRFLISILRKGLPKTIHAYTRYIGKITKKANAYFETHPRQERDQHLHEWTLIRAEETLALLEKTKKTLDIAFVSSALVLHHMK